MTYGKCSDDPENVFPVLYRKNCDQNQYKKLMIQRIQWNNMFPTQVQIK